MEVGRSDGDGQDSGGLSRRRCALVILGLAVALAALLLALGPLPQPPAYHDFADQRPLSWIPNFADVVSNLAFTIPGLVGLGMMIRYPDLGRPHARLPLWAFFSGAVLVSLGSGYYHLDPNNTTLVPDRLGMSLSFMGLFAAVLSDRLHPVFGKPLPLLLILLAGAACVLWWYWSEIAGAGDLRPYYFLNPGLPVLVVVFLALARPGHAIPAWGLFGALGIYGFAIILEQFDHELFHHLDMAASGHTLKHIAAGGGVVFIVIACWKARRA